MLVLAAPTAWAVETDAVVRHYAELAYRTYDDALEGAKVLRDAVDDLTRQPGTESLQLARQAWLHAREAYGQTEALRFYGGPIDGAHGPEGRLNAWPLDESYVDGVRGRPDAGLVQQVSFRISKSSIARMNERGGEENIASGWHAIEFLLWGQDFDSDGPGRRSAEDFIDGQATHADRRRLYLRVVTQLLVEDLTGLVRSWAPGQRNYRARFEKGGRESLRKMLVGLGALSRGELAGERLEVALASQDQEDEHSCFSDNTHRDVVNNALGIQNVWLGRHRALDGTQTRGPSLRDRVADLDPALADRMTAQFERSVQAAERIQPPFDREIVGAPDAPGRMRVQATIDSLIAQSELIVEAAEVLGIRRLQRTRP